jgi:Zn-dependent protease with chaperone function
MTFDGRLLVVAFASFAIPNVFASVAMARVWRWRLAVDASPTRRAFELFWLRMAPAALGFLTSLFTILAFMRYEPRQSGEATGVFLPALSLAAALVLAAGAGRVLLGHLRTNRLARHWMRTAQPMTLPEVPLPCFRIDTTFPVVAVVGVFHPRLFVSGVVLDACPANELRAVLSHERRHVLQRDNARRLAFLAVPDLPAWLPIGRQFEETWHDAVEEAADDGAADVASRVDLAAALVRVARLVPPGQLAIDLPASALYRGEPLDRRVRRLLTDPPAAAPPAWRVWHLAAALCVVAAGLASLGAIQGVVEVAVKFLP